MSRYIWMVTLSAVASCSGHSSHGIAPGTAHLSVESPASGDLVPGTAVVLYADSALAQPAVDATLGGTPVTLKALDAHRFGMLIPDVAPGTHAFAADGFAALELAIAAAPAIDEPMAVVSNEATALRTELAGRRGDAPAYYDDALAAADALDQALAAASPDDLAAAARIVVANRALFDALVVPRAAELLDSWDRNAIGFVLDWSLMGAAIVLTTAAVATANPLAIAASALALKAAYANLQGRYDQTEAEVFTQIDMITQNTPRTLAPGGGVRFLQGVQTLLPLTATFRAVHATDTMSQDATVREVAEILGSIDTAIAGANEVLDRDLVAPPPLDTGTTTRPFRGDEIALAADRSDVSFSIYSLSYQPLVVSTDPGASCHGVDNIPFTLTATIRTIDGGMQMQPFPASVRCHATAQQFVIDRVDMATDGATARAYAVDINGDGSPDNQLGMIHVTLAQQGCTVLTTANPNTVYGQLDAYGLVTPFDARLRLFAPPVAGVVGPPLADMSTSGAPDFAWRGDGQLSIELPVFDMLTTLGLRGVAASESAGSALSGNIGGAIAQADIDQKLVPIAWQCVATNPSSTALALFDANHDGQISLDEFANNALVQSLFAPDVIVDGVKALSVGVRFTASSAAFQIP